MAAQRRFRQALASPRLHDAAEPCPPPPDRERERFVAWLRQAGIAMIAGPDLVQAMKGHDPLPPFPRGGTHRSLLAGARVSGRLVAAIARSLGRDVGELAIDPPQWRVPPTGSDAGLARLLNLWRPPVDYPTGSASHRWRSAAAGRSTRLIAVDSYFYYDLGRFDWMLRRRYPVHCAVIKWRDELDEPTVLRVEMNERLIGQGVLSCLDRFLGDLRAALR